MMNVLIAALNFASNWWAAWLLAASLEAVLLLAMVGLVWLAIRRRVAPHVGYCLFLLVPFKLLVPVVVTVPASVAPWTPAALVASWLQGDHAGVQIEQKGLDAAESAAPSTDLSQVDLKQTLHSRPVLSEAATGLPGSRTEPSADRREPGLLGLERQLCRERRSVRDPRGSAMDCFSSAHRGRRLLRGGVA